jgi:hypothetical protein
MTITPTPPTNDVPYEDIDHNAERVKRGLKSLDDYAASEGGLDRKSAFGDHLADLMHTAKHLGLSFEELLAIASEHYEEEVEGEGAI